MEPFLSSSAPRVRIAAMRTLAELAGVPLPPDSPRRAALEIATARVPGADDYRDRRGYDPLFLQGFAVPLPVLADPGDAVALADGSGVVLRYENFSIVMSRARRLAHFTACNIDGSRSRRQRRDRDVWYYDGRLEPDAQAGEDLYRDNDLDRGHLVRREDPVWGEQFARANEDTFHFTNCAPQHKGLNQKTWLGLEDYLLQNARAHELHVSVFTGPVFRADDPEYRGVRIPREFWKVVALVSEGRPSATAYLISQDALLGDLEFLFGRYKTYQVSILRVQALTGLDFGELAHFDGFSNEEEATGVPQKTEVDAWERIRV